MALTQLRYREAAQRFGEASRLARDGGALAESDHNAARQADATIKVICTEPKEDASRRALMQAAQASSVRSPQKPGKQLESATAEAARENSLIQDLRAGLYPACQSYAAGVIKSDEYAKILEKYHDAVMMLMSWPGDAKPP